METEEIAFPGAGVHLSGSVTCPDTAGACPGLVLVGGSGPSDRHNDGFFDALRAHLASTGVSVAMRYLAVDTVQTVPAMKITSGSDTSGDDPPGGY